MNSAPDQAPERPSPARDAGTRPSAASSDDGVRSGLQLKTLQKYLAPLERLGSQKVAWVGSALLFIGIFLPAKAVSIPYAGITLTASIWDFSKLESLLLLMLAIASVALAYVRDYKWLWVTGIGASFFLVIEFFDALTNSVLHPSWGWFVLFPGVALVLASAAMKRDPGERSGDAVTIVRHLAQRFSQSQ